MTFRPPHLARPLAAALALAAAPARGAVPGGSAACTPTRVGPGVASLGEPWRRAAAELAQASAQPGLPWSCGGGVIEIVIDSTRRGRGATLTITEEDGRSIAREVTSPDEVVPLGEALLSKPLPPPRGHDDPPGPAGHERAAPPPDVVAPAPGTPLAEPRVLISATVAPRYAGKSKIIWGGLTAGVIVPIGAWGVGGWGRYDGLAASLDGPDPHLSEVVIGASASRSFRFQKLELRASVVPSVAIVTRSIGFKPSVEETRVDGRIGLEGRLVVPIIPLLRAVAAFDVELSPRELREKDDHDRGSMMPGPAYPSYTLGLGLGLEIAIR